MLQSVAWQWRGFLISDAVVPLRSFSAMTPPLRAAPMLATSVVAALAALLAAVPAPAAAQQGNTEDGAEVFKKCRACHDVGPGAKNKVGPLLNGVIGRKAGTIEGFNYSQANKNAGEKGLVWTPDVLFEYLENPLTFMPGTKMAFAGLKAEQDRRDVVAYLQKFAP
jgi:cytochrome c